MQGEDKGNLFTRDDTFFGVCEGLGEDLGIPSNLFRMAFALGFFFSAQGALIAYAALGALVLFSRLVFPKPRAPRRTGGELAGAAPLGQPAAGTASAGAGAETDQQMDRLPIAA